MSAKHIVKKLIDINYAPFNEWCSINSGSNQIKCQQIRNLLKSQVKTFLKCSMIFSQQKKKNNFIESL